MGIQDRDYWRERYGKVPQEHRDYSQQLRDLEAKGQRVDIPVEKPERRRFKVIDEVRASQVSVQHEAKPAGSYKVAYLLAFAVFGLLAFLVYKIASTMF